MRRGQAYRTAGWHRFLQSTPRRRSCRSAGSDAGGGRGKTQSCTFYSWAHLYPIASWAQPDSRAVSKRAGLKRAGAPQGAAKRAYAGAWAPGPWALVLRQFYLPRPRDVGRRRRHRVELRRSRSRQTSRSLSLAHGRSTLPPARRGATRRHAAPCTTDGRTRMPGSPCTRGHGPQGWLMRAVGSARQSGASRWGGRRASARGAGGAGSAQRQRPCTGYTREGSPTSCRRGSCLPGSPGPRTPCCALQHRNEEQRSLI